MILIKIDGIHARKIRFWKNHRGQSTRIAKKTQKMGFPAIFWSPEFHGRRRPWAWRPWSMVAATMGQGRRATMGLGPILGPSSGRRIFAVSWSFLMIFLPVFFLTFPLIYWPVFAEENLPRSHANWSAKFPIFLESQRLCRRELPISCQALKLGQTMSE